MLIEIWERLRGYDKWIQTEATILSSKLTKPGVVLSDNGRFAKLLEPWQWHLTCTIGWNDALRNPYTACYTVGELSALYQLYNGQNVIIRYNPASPEDYYLRDLLINKTSSTIKEMPRFAYFAFILYWIAHELWRHFH